jgi:mannosyltransferase OCH1-like enzyme
MNYNIKDYTNLLYCIIIIFSFFYFIDNTIAHRNLSLERFENETIPKIIIQTWKTKEIPAKYKNDISSLRKHNSDFKFMFFSDEDIEIFLQKNYPEYYDTYVKLPVKIQKIDYFRYVAIYHYGGFYFDLDVTGLYPIKELIKYDCVFPVDQNIQKYKCDDDRFKNYCKENMTKILGQYAFGAKPRNYFIKTLINTINNNIDNYIQEYNKNGSSLQYIYSSTGPDFVTDVYMNYKFKKDIYILNYKVGQHFGKYAKHNFYGTWKNK